MVGTLTTEPCLRGCLGIESEGERDELWDEFVPDFETRTPRYGPIKRGRIRPKIARAAQKQNLNSLSSTLSHSDGGNIGVRGAFEGFGVFSRSGFQVRHRKTRSPSASTA